MSRWPLTTGCRAMNNRWPSPAKLNLFLHIVGRRHDGYHLLQTVFQFIDQGDFLTFHSRDDGRIHRYGDLPGVTPEQDLIQQAAGLLQRVTGVNKGADIGIEKKLPMGGGLGGGSSNAATTLIALNHYWQTGLSLNQLAELGLQLGADVPVFILGHSAWAEGVGENLTPIILPEPWFVVLCPPCHVSTAKIFSDQGLTRDAKPMTICAFVERQGVFGNVFEPLVFRDYPDIRKAAEWLKRYGEVRLTGTGACIFAAFDSRQEAAKVLRKCPEGLKGFISRGRCRSPLHEHWRKVV